ncbi:MAG: endolytic transglycosylase MltG [Rhodospirillaceae bacterium]
MFARLAAPFLFLLVVIGAAAGGAYLWFARSVLVPGPLQETKTLVIESGSGLGAIARQLERGGVIAHARLFELQARRSGQARALKPGEYRFEPGISVVAALDKIVRRDVVVRFVTVPEGLVTKSIQRILDEAPGLVGEPGTDIADGDLLPETYRYEWGDTRAALTGRMRAARDQALAELWESRTPDLPIATPQEAVILASIVEKETGIAAERPRVAAVFLNRLKRGMKLQSDPTVIYGIAPEAGDLERSITRADLETPTPFNTYIVTGLPPSPICHPGRAALAAVLKPIQSDELYFVADGTGGHAFAATLAEHNKNVARWRQIERETKTAP